MASSRSCAAACALSSSQVKPSWIGVAGTTTWKWVGSPDAIRSAMAAVSSGPPSVWFPTTR